MSITRSRRIVASAAVGAVVAAGLSAAVATADPEQNRPLSARHVLVISVDGLHQSDLAQYVASHPNSALAYLTKTGTAFTDARTTFPSDSFPGMVAQFTGAGPGASGVYYDDTYNRTLLPAGTLDCSTATPGAEAPWTEAADRSQNPITLDAGQGLTDPALKALTTNTKAQTISSAPAITKAILHMTPTPQALLNPAALPVDPATCLPLYPHQYLRTNTVFNVVRAAGGLTAWSDKHPAYEILSGPSGTGIQDLFTPEINSVADAAGDDWTTDNALTQVYDGVKVAAVVNEIAGFDHSGTRKIGTPQVFGMNLQTLSTAQKLPVSDGLQGGYLPSGAPGPLVARALDFVDAQLRTMAAALKKAGLQGSTDVILSAKHGQSPIDPTALRRVNDGTIIAHLDAAWKSIHPGASDLVSFSTDDDGMLLWLSNRSAEALAFAKSYLLGHSAPANTIDDPKGTYSTTVASSGLTAVYTGDDADRYVGAPQGDTHAPDLIGIAQHGVVYTGGVKKIAEHGGAAADDRNVALVAAGPGIGHGLNNAPVQTSQIAPSILTLLGLNPDALDAVRASHGHDAASSVLPMLQH